MNWCSCEGFFLSSHFSWYFDRSESDNPCLYFYISMSAKKCGKSLKFMCLLFYVLHPLRWQRCAFSLPQEVTRIANVQWLSFSSIITMITSVQCFFFWSVYVSKFVFSVTDFSAGVWHVWIWCCRHAFRGVGSELSDFKCSCTHSTQNSPTGSLG